MTILTSYRKGCSDVVRIIGPIIIFFMAGETIGGETCVLSILMAVYTIGPQMGTSQRKISIIVIKGGRRPGQVAVTLLALMRILSL